MLENNAIRTAITIESSKNPLEVQVAVRQFATSYGYNRYVFYSASVNHDAIIDRIFGSKATGLTAKKSMS